MLLMCLGRISWAAADPEAGCKAGDAAACFALGEASAAAKDTRAAASAYGKACKLGSAEACGRAGDLAKEAGNDPRAAAWFEQGCTAGDRASCGGRAKIAYNANDNEATLLWGKKGCILSEAEVPPCAASDSCKTAVPKACRTTYAAADELQQFDLAFTAALTACRLGDRPMCKIAYDTPHITDTQRMEVLQRGCDEAGDPAVCNEYGVQLCLGDLVPKDDVRGMMYIHRACDAGDMQACTSLADTALSDPRTEQDALPYLDKLCTGGSARACREATELRARAK